MRSPQIYLEAIASLLLSLPSPSLPFSFPSFVNPKVSYATSSGLLDYSDPISKHWPEFAAYDDRKSSVTVADILQHQAGLSAFPQGVYLTKVRGVKAWYLK